MLQIKVGADIRQAIQALKNFGTEIDRAGGVTEATANKMASALNKALNSAQILSKGADFSGVRIGLQEIVSQTEKVFPNLRQLKTLFDGLSIKGVNAEGLSGIASQVKDGSISLGQFIKTLNLTETEVQQLAQRLEGLGLIKVEPKIAIQTTGLDVAQKLEEARQRIFADIEKKANIALGITSETPQINTAPAMKSIQQLENEMDELRQRILQTTDVNLGQKLSVQLAALQAEANKLKAVFTSVSQLKITGTFNGGLIQQVRAFGGGVAALQNPLRSTQTALSAASSANQRFKNATGASTQTLVDFGRILQDAPFGLIGIANNINPVVEGFRRLSLTAKETGVSVGKQLLSSLAGAGGLAFAFSGITAAIQFAVIGLDAWTRGFGNATKKSDELKEKLKELIKPLDDIRDSATGDTQGEIAKVQALSNIVLNQTKSYQERNRALTELKEINKGYFGDLTIEQEQLGLLKTKVDDYTKALLAKAVVNEFSSEIAKVSKELFVQRTELGKTVKGWSDLNKQFKTLGQTEQGQQLPEGGFILPETGEAEKRAKNAFKAVQTQKKVVEDIFNQLQLLKQGLEEAVNEQIKLPRLNIETPTTKTDKDKFEFLFDFLPFDPSGKLKPEQRSQILDAIDKFQKEFSGIFKGVQFSALAKNDNEKINLALKFDADLKLGKVKFDTEALRKSIDDSIKPEELFPPDALSELPKIVVDQYIRGMQDASEQIKNTNPLNLPVGFNINTDLKSQIEIFKTKLQQIGAQIPNEIEANDIFGNPITVSFDQLFDTSKIANNDALEALRKAFEKIRGTVIDQKTQTVSAVQEAVASMGTEMFASLGTSLGNAISGKGIGDAFKALFSFIGDSISALGRRMIALSPVIAALKAGIKSLNPAILLPAGIGLVAIGTLLKNIKPQGFAKGGWVGGSGNGDTVPAMLTPGEYVVTKDKAPLVVAFLKLLRGGITKSMSSLKLPLHFATGGLVPDIRNTDVTTPLSSIQKVLSGAAFSQSTTIIPDVKIKGSDLVLVFNRTNQSQFRNFGR